MGEVNSLLIYGARAGQKEWNFQTPAYKVRSGIHDQRTVHQFEVNNTNFPTTTSTGADLFLILHKVISQLTRLGLYIMTVTCDGARENRLLFSLHDKKNDKTVYKIKNVYTNAGHPLFHIWSKPFNQNYPKLFSKKNIEGMF